MLTASDVLQIITTTFETVFESEELIIGHNAVFIPIALPALEVNVMAGFYVDEQRQEIVLEVEADDLPKLSSKIEKALILILPHSLLPFLDGYGDKSGEFLVSRTKGRGRTIIYVARLCYKRVGEDEESVEQFADQLCEMLNQSVRTMGFAHRMIGLAKACGGIPPAYESLRELTLAHGLLEIHSLVDQKTQTADTPIIRCPRGLYGDSSVGMSACN